MTGSRPRLIAVMGQTGTGKTALAEALAERLEAQLINADAFQVYRGFDIGTAKPWDRDRYALLDFKDPRESYGVGEFVALAQPRLQELFAQGRSAVLVGGTGFYVRALLEQYDGMAGAPDPALRAELARQELGDLVLRLRTESPEIAATIDLENGVRVRRALERLSAPRIPAPQLPPFLKTKLAIILDQETLWSRLERRTHSMIENGWIEEVSEIQRMGVPEEAPAMRAIGYRCLARHLQREIPREDAVRRIVEETRRYAKRQRTWLRSEPELRDVDGAAELRHQLEIALGVLSNGQSH